MRQKTGLSLSNSLEFVVQPGADRPGGTEGTRQPVVLVVDDHSINHFLASAELDDLCKVVSAQNGSVALEKAETLRPDLILLDVNMPGGMDGFEVCRCLKSNPDTESIPVIFLTAVSDIDSEEKGLALGAVDYIHKPFHPPILRARVRNHLLMQDQRRQLEVLSHIDPLTRLLNRRGFDDTLRREWQRSARQGRPLALVLLQIDRFAAYSYSCGHHQGEALLQELASLFTSELHRGNDYLARYKADCFACLLGDTDLAGAAVIVDRIAAQMKVLTIPDLCVPGASVVTISAGLASQIPQAGRLADVSDLLTRASRNLEEAVLNGGGQRVAR